MKSKRTARSRPKISFAVDRDDIDVNSDWVEAVMAVPTAKESPLPPSPSSDSPVESIVLPPAHHQESGISAENTATGDRDTSGEASATAKDGDLGADRQEREPTDRELLNYNFATGEQNASVAPRVA